MGKIFVVGMGPGDEKMMTLMARQALEQSDVIVGYKTYIGLIKPLYPHKEYFENGMGGEAERCRKAAELARNEGKTVCVICSGDAGVYGMASPMLELLGENEEIEVEVVAGVTAALSGGAELGAPLSNDFCVISLSDLLTPHEVIKKRLECAAEADLCMVLYNPSSRGRQGHLKKACSILLEKLPENTVCGYVRNIGRAGTEKKLCSLRELSGEETDMFTTVFIGNSSTRIINGKMVTVRGYKH